jgi:lysophospholipase L1-like esterase
MRPLTAISANYLERLADPASRFHGDYLAHRSKQITRAELVARLPHVAMIGDSLSRDIYIASPVSTFWRAHTRRGKNWFFDVDPSPRAVNSVSKRLDKLTPFVAIQCGGLGAMIDSEGKRPNFSRKILGTRNFSGQVGQLLSARRFPDLILIWIGHNNVDWAWRCPADELQQPETRLRRQSERFRQDYTRQIRRLIDRAITEQHRVAITIYGLVDFESFFKAREIAETLRAKNPRLYPYLGSDLKYFISMRPAYRRNLIRLTRMVNDGLCAMATELQITHAHSANLQVRYSDALAKADLSRVEVIHSVDGWHPSVEGHNVFAAAAFNDLRPSLEFLQLA